MEATSVAQRPQFLTTLCILSYIGSGLWALFSIIGMVASSWIMSLLGIGMATAMENPEAIEGIDPAQLEQATEAANGIMGMGTTFFILIFLVSLVLAAVSILGVAKMWKQKKSGFIMYSVVNGLMLILFLIGGSWGAAIFSAAFIGMYAANLKHMS